VHKGFKSGGSNDLRILLLVFDSSLEIRNVISSEYMLMSSLLNDHSLPNLEKEPRLRPRRAARRLAARRLPRCVPSIFLLFLSSAELLLYVVLRHRRVDH